MNKWSVRAVERDNDGWVEIVLIVQPMVEQDGVFHDNEDGETSEGETLGHVREVEGTVEGPVTWWDARVIEEHHGMQMRRFTSLDDALMALLGFKFAPAMMDWK
jgi:hypothetical protein